MFYKKVLLWSLILPLSCEGQSAIKRTPLQELTPTQTNSTIETFKNCIWTPNKSSWTGDDVLLLKAIGLSYQGILSFTLKRRNNSFSHIVSINSTTIYQDAWPYRLYYPYMDMGSGKNSLCMNTIPDPLLNTSHEARVYYLPPRTYIAVFYEGGHIARIYLDKFLFKPLPKEKGFQDIKPSKPISVSVPKTLYLYLIGIIYLFFRVKANVKYY